MRKFFRNPKFKEEDYAISKIQEFPYTAMGQSQAKKFQKETSGKLTSNLRSDMKKKYGKKKA